MLPKDAEGISNSVDPDQTAPLGAVLTMIRLLLWEQSDLSLHCLARPICPLDQHYLDLDQHYLTRPIFL